MVAAAGSGERLGAGGPKAFVPLAGRPMVEWSIAALRAAPSVRAIVVAAPPGHAHDFGDSALVVAGGATRSESVASALEAVEDDLVAVHDAARPLLAPALVESLLGLLLSDPEAAGAIAAAPLTDTIKLAHADAAAAGGNADADAAGGNADPTRRKKTTDAEKNSPVVVASTLDRSRLWAAQTPQVFHTAVLRSALAEAERRAAATDEASLVEAAGGTVLIHPAPETNIKVTTPLDLRLAELLLAERQPASG